VEELLDNAQKVIFEIPKTSCARVCPVGDILGSIRTQTSTRKRRYRRAERLRSRRQDRRFQRDLIIIVAAPPWEKPPCSQYRPGGIHSAPRIPLPSFLR
jgi:hypothetical protein